MGCASPPTFGPMKLLPDKLRRYPPPETVFCLLTTGLLLAFAQLWRLILLLATADRAQDIPLWDMLGSFVVGFRLDMVVAAIALIPLTLLTLFPFSRVRALGIFVLAFIWLFGALTFFAHLADIEFFKFFNLRLNGVAMIWRETPGQMFDTVWSTYPVMLYLALYISTIALFCWATFKTMRYTRTRSATTSWKARLLFALILLPLFGIGLRGRVASMSPVRWGAAFFSEYNYANQLALNPVYTFVRDALWDASRHEIVADLVDNIRKPDHRRTIIEMIGAPDSLIASESRIYRSMIYPPPADTPNVILIIMETFGSSGIGALDNLVEEDLSPHFDSISKRGVLFTNAYSGGATTQAGIFSSLFGMSHGIGREYTKAYSGAPYSWGLPQVLKSHGYRTVFFAPHDPHYDNLQGFLGANGVSRIYSIDDYELEREVGVWGIDDHVLYNNSLRILRELSGSRFFATILTVSNHGPWDVPDKPFGRLPEGSENERKYNGFKYSDWALGQFIDSLSNDPYFDNTLVLITSDNGVNFHKRIALDPTFFRIPLLMIKLNSTDLPAARVSTLGSQLDITATVMGQLRLSYDNYTFGRDLLDSQLTTKPFAHFSVWLTGGLVENDYLLIDQFDGPSSLYHLSDLSKNLSGEMPDLTRELSKKTRALFSESYYQLKTPFTTRPDERR